MNLKNGVHIENLHPTLVKTLRVADQLWPLIYPEDIDGLTITSGHEGSSDDVHRVHAAGSCHYVENNKSGKGEAVDIRLNDVVNFRADIFSFTLKIIMHFVHSLDIKAAPEKIFTQSAHVHIQL